MPNIKHMVLNCLSSKFLLSLCPYSRTETFPPSSGSLKMLFSAFQCSVHMVLPMPSPTAIFLPRSSLASGFLYRCCSRLLLYCWVVMLLFTLCTLLLGSSHAVLFYAGLLNQSMNSILPRKKKKNTTKKAFLSTFHRLNIGQRLFHLHLNIFHYGKGVKITLHTSAVWKSLLLWISEYKSHSQWVDRFCLTSTQDITVSSNLTLVWFLY